ncbi:MAG TPA: biotin/lipoyl-containing protein [Candidatus Limnocylindria bacterium]
MTDQPDALDAISLAADELVPQLAERLRRHGLAEIEVSRGDLRLRVTATPETSGKAPTRTAGATAAAVPAAIGSPGATGTAELTGSVGVASPAVGYFVYADGLGPGLEVARGDALGHVEMLGVRHDVRSPRGGTVRNLVAEAGEAVEYGQVVLELDPTGSAA